MDPAPPRLPDSVAVRSVLGPPATQPVVAEITEPAGEGNGGVCPPAPHRDLSHHRDAGVRPLRRRPARGIPRVVPDPRPVSPAWSNSCGSHGNQGGAGERPGIAARAIHRGQPTAGGPVRRASAGACWKVIGLHLPVRSARDWSRVSTDAAIRAARGVSSGARLGGRCRHLEPAGRRAEGGPAYPILRCGRPRLRPPRHHGRTDAIKTGEPAPPFSLTDATGNRVSLADLGRTRRRSLLLPQGRHAGLHQGGVRIPRRVDELRAARRGGPRRLARFGRFARALR